MDQKNVVICALPQLVTHQIPGAPAMLQAGLESAGISAQSLDLSIDFFINQCSRDVNKYHMLSAIFRPTNELIPDESRSAANEWVASSITKLKKINPKIIGLSVFTNFQQNAAVMLALAIRKELKDSIIVLGGWGLTFNCVGLRALENIKKIDLLKPFHQFMQEQKLADEIFLSNDNPLARFTNFVEQKLKETVSDSNFLVTEKTNYKTPIPNYDDYTLSNYLWDFTETLPVTGSLGCVRQCTFCDIPGQFGKFKFRTGEDIGHELIHLKEKYNVSNFDFTDSLVNGSLKAFIQWLEIVADYNDSHNEDKITWTGQYICRPQNQIPSNFYSLMKRSGVKNLGIGVESGSDQVLEAMKKKITVKDVYDELEMFKKYDIKTTILMISGFYNETYERFLETLAFIVKCRPYFINGTITDISIGPPLYINDQMQLGSAANELGIIIDPYDWSNWKSSVDSDNTYIERARRRLIVEVLKNRLGMPPTAQSNSTVYQMLQKLKNMSTLTA